MSICASRSKNTFPRAFAVLPLKNCCAAPSDVCQGDNTAHDDEKFLAEQAQGAEHDARQVQVARDVELEGQAFRKVAIGGAKQSALQPGDQRHRRQRRQLPRAAHGLGHALQDFGRCFRPRRTRDGDLERRHVRELHHQYIQPAEPQCVAHGRNEFAAFAVHVARNCVSGSERKSAQRCWKRMVERREAVCELPQRYAQIEASRRAGLASRGTKSSGQFATEVLAEPRRFELDYRPQVYAAPGSSACPARSTNALVGLARWRRAFHGSMLGRKLARYVHCAMQLVVRADSCFGNRNDSHLSDSPTKARS